MKRTPAETRWDRWQAAVDAARAKLRALASAPDQPVSQSEVQRRTEELGERVTQRTVGRFIDGASGTTVDTLFAILSVVPEAEDAFEASLSPSQPSDVEAASWQRLAARLARLMDVEAGHRLVDAIEDLASLDALNDSWPHLRQPAIDIRQRRARREQDRGGEGAKSREQVI